MLAIGGAAIGTSGHALRLMHMRHHARPFAVDDFEGAAARMSFWRALVAAPQLAVALHIAAWRTGRERPWQALEYALLVALAVAACIGPRWLAIHVAIAFAMQAFAPWWAGHVPHRAGWLISFARRLAVTRSPTLAASRITAYIIFIRMCRRGGCASLRARKHRALDGGGDSRSPPPRISCGTRSTRTKGSTACSPRPIDGALAWCRHLRSPRAHARSLPTATTLARRLSSRLRLRDATVHSR